MSFNSVSHESIWYLADISSMAVSQAAGTNWIACHQKNLNGNQESHSCDVSFNVYFIISHKEFHSFTYPMQKRMSMTGPSSDNGEFDLRPSIFRMNLNELGLTCWIKYFHFNKLDLFPCNIFAIISNLIYRVWDLPRLYRRN